MLAHLAPMPHHCDHIHWCSSSYMMSVLSYSDREGRPYALVEECDIAQPFGPTCSPNMYTTMLMMMVVTFPFPLVHHPLLSATTEICAALHCTATPNDSFGALFNWPSGDYFVIKVRPLGKHWHVQMTTFAWSHFSFRGDSGDMRKEISTCQPVPAPGYGQSPHEVFHCLCTMAGSSCFLQ